MATLRNTRLEQLLGGRIDENLSYDQVKGLIPTVAEAPDLDYKGISYTPSERDRKALSVDVAALANAGGGIILLGMEQDSQGRAAKDVGVSITDAEQQRLRQTIVGNIQPIPTFGVIPVEDPARPGVGFLIIWVARSAGAPHAYVPQNKSLFFPRRIGTEIVYLTEADVAEEYRARFAGLQSRLDETARVEMELAEHLAPDQVFVIVTLVPDLPGRFTIDTAALNTFQAENASRARGAFGVAGRQFSISKVGRRRLIGTGTLRANEPYSRIACELHQNGSGCFATAVENVRPDAGQPGPTLVEDEVIVHGIATGVLYLAQHASVRANAGGLATLRVTLQPFDPAQSIALVENRSWQNERVGAGDFLRKTPVAETVADLDDLCAGGAELIKAVYRLASDLFQEFGAPETVQVTPDGGIRLEGWKRGYAAGIVQWAEQVGVEVTRQPLD